MAYYSKKRRSTGYIRMKFQSFMDISTSDSSMQIITVSAGGKEIIKRCPAQFGAYKYYRIGGVSIKLIPASTLPVDPTGLSIATGDNLVDPRDQLTPGMIRITNGEDILEDITGMSDAEQHGIYNNMLLDPRWYKWMLQTGVKRYATPRYWQIGQLHQDKWPGSIYNIPLLTSGALSGTVTQADAAQVGDSTRVNVSVSNAGAYGFFQTGHTGRLGWLPTDGLAPTLTASGNTLQDHALLASPPEVEVMKILLPKAYKTKYWYRLFITETVEFREPIVTMCGVDNYRPLDIFHATVPPTQAMPTYINTLIDRPLDSETGGNYGNN